MGKPEEPEDKTVWKGERGVLYMYSADKDEWTQIGYTLKPKEREALLRIFGFYGSLFEDNKEKVEETLSHLDVDVDASIEMAKYFTKKFSKSDEKEGE